MKKAMEVLIDKLNSEYKGRKLILQIAQMCEYYCDYQRWNDQPKEDLAKLLFNIIYSFVGGEENIQGLLMTNPLLVEYFSSWNNFLQNNFKEQKFSQAFKRSTERLVYSSIVLESELPNEFYLKLFYNLMDEKRYQVLIPKIQPQCDAFEKNILFLTKSEIKDFIRCLAISKDFQADTKIKALVSSLIFDNNISLLLSLSFMFNVKPIILNLTNLQKLEPNVIFGLLLQQGERNG